MGGKHNFGNGYHRDLGLVCGIRVLDWDVFYHEITTAQPLTQNRGGNQAMTECFSLTSNPSTPPLDQEPPSQQPTLQTQRLILRPFVLEDAPEVQRLAGDRAIAATTLLIPHPYKDGMAEAWIETHPAAFAKKTAVTFAIVLRATEKLCGAVGLSIDTENNSAELGYWIGQPYWGQGYCTEAGKAVLRYGFEALQLHRIHSLHFATNPASGRVMQKIGMRYEGCRRQDVLKWGTYEDTELYGILKSDWQAETVTF